VQRGGAEHGEHTPLRDLLAQSAHDVFDRQGTFGKELFHQLVLAFGDELDESFMGFLGGGGHGGGDFADLASAVAIGRVVKGLHGN